MNIKLRDLNGRVVQEVEVDDVFGEFYVAMEAKEHTEERKYRYHCPASIDDCDCEGEWFASHDETPAQYVERREFEERIPAFLKTLTPIQLRRLVLIAEEESVRAAAKKEGISLASMQETRRQIQAKFVSFFGYDPRKGK